MSPTRFRRTRPAAIALCLLVGSGTSLPSGEDEERSAPTGASTPEGPECIGPVTIGEDTTVLSEPRDEDGWIDYLAWVNERGARGVTRENNIVSGIVASAGTGDVEPEVLRSWLEALGLDRSDLPEARFVTFWTWIEGIEDAGQDEAFEQTQAEGGGGVFEGHWPDEGAPLVARWLDEQSTVLDGVTRAARRPRFHSPLIDPDGHSLLAARQPILMEVRNLSEALIARAARRSRGARPERAVESLEAVVSFGEGLLEDRTLIGQLVAHALRTVAWRAAVTIAHEAPVPAAALERLVAGQEVADTSRGIAETLDTTERFFVLDTMLMLLRDPGSAPVLGALSLPEEVRESLLSQELDWDRMLRRLNEHIDGTVAAARELTATARARAVRRLESKCRRIGKRTGGNLAKLAAALSVDARSDLLADYVYALIHPNTSSAITSADEARIEAELARLGVRIAIHRRREGGYPTRLGELVPETVRELPEDPYGDGPYLYERLEDGFRLRSVGADGERAAYDPLLDQHGDDIVVTAGARPEEENNAEPPSPDDAGDP